MIRYSLGILQHYFTWPCALGMVLTGLAAAWVFRLCERKQIRTPFRPRAASILCAYLFLILWFLVLGRTDKGGNHLALRLFWSYRAIRMGKRYLIWLDLLNVLLFVPVGVLLPRAWPKAGPLRTVGLGAGISLLGELLQLLTSRGMFELDDLFHNLIGTALGVLILKLLMKYVKAQRKREKENPAPRRCLSRLQDKLINNYATSFFWFGHKYLQYRIPMRLASILYPVEKNKAVFMSFNGRNYADNPRAISEKLHELHPDWTVVWGFSSLEKDRITVPDYVHTVQYGSWAWYRELATAGTWVMNVLLPNGVLKRKGQRYIQTWHGDRGMKKILFDATESMEKYQKRNYFRRIIEPTLCDLGITGSAYGEMQFRSAMHYEGELLRTGTPRDDCLLHLTEARRTELKEMLGLPKEARILLYAPTFRDHLHGAEQKAGELDVVAVLAALEKKTGQPWHCVQRGHHVGAHLENRDVYAGRVTDLTAWEDMAEILCVTDLLITDYSSTPGDIALAGKGTILYQEDYESYVSDDRQLYFRMEDTPFLIAHNQKEMLEQIGNWNEEAAADNAQKILGFYKTYETGSASEAVVAYICGTKQEDGI